MRRKDSRTRQQASIPKRPAIMAHMVLGYPTLAKSEMIARALMKGGASYLELQIPFSDPIADGPTIMAANEQALREKVRPTDCLRAAARITRSTGIPVFLMSYANILYSFRGGVRGFCRAAARAGVQGLIVPDIPHEETSVNYWKEARAAGLLPISFVSPVTSEARMTRIARQSRDGFLYCIARTGTTGVRSKVEQELGAYLRKVRKHFSIPLAVGFGISNRKHIDTLRGLADIAIVGSATIDIVRKHESEKDAALAGRIARFIQTLAVDR